MTLSKSRRNPIYAILICCVLSVAILSPLLPPELETLFWSQGWMKLSLALAALVFSCAVGLMLAMTLGEHPAIAIHYEGQFLTPWVVMTAATLTFGSIFLWSVGFVSPISLLIAICMGIAITAWTIFPLFKRL
jgi:ABC-type sugar transport system permease subunit